MPIGSPNGTDWALGIESADNRSRDQLHIHISRLIPDARKDIDKQWKAIATDESKWKDSVITVLGKKFRVERRHPKSQPVQASERRHRHAVQGADAEPNNARHRMCSQHVQRLDRPQQRQGRSNTNPGANNIEFLLDKG